MKQITVRIILSLIVFTWTACLAQASGESRTGLYAKKNQTAELIVKESPGLYEVKAPQAEGSLRAGSTEGDDEGNPNKVPIRDNFLVLIIGATAYFILRKTHQRRFLSL